MDNTSVFKTTVFAASKHVNVFNTAVFLETVILDEYFKNMNQLSGISKNQYKLPHNFYVPALVCMPTISISVKIAVPKMVELELTENPRSRKTDPGMFCIPGVMEDQHVSAHRNLKDGHLLVLLRLMSCVF